MENALDIIDRLNESNIRETTTQLNQLIPDGTISKIVTYHTNVRALKADLISYVDVYFKNVN